MAEKSILETPARLIPTFGMDKPWTEPTTPEEDEGLASLAFLAGAGDTNRAVSQFIRQVDNTQYQQLIQAARGVGRQA